MASVAMWTLRLGMGFALLLGFVGALFVGSLLLPGRDVNAPGNSVSAPRYRLNGLILFVLCLLLFGSGLLSGLLSLALVRNLWDVLFVSANVFALGAALILTRAPRGGMAKGNPMATGQWLRQFYFGTALNPSWRGVDLKLFSYRPSLIGLAIINASFAWEQVERHGTIGQRMVLYQVLYLVYIANYFQFEEGMLHTWDMLAERFGWMLIWGDYVFVPFFYSLPAWYLVDRLDPMPAYQCALLLVLYTFGFWLFRGANGQKHRFKRNPHSTIWGRPAETIDGRILVSGFWSIGRKLNYSGELCMYYAWTLACGTSHWIPFALPLWLTGLLVHRAMRDERRCRQKYGALWDRYCRRARFRMFPLLY